MTRVWETPAIGVTLGTSANEGFVIESKFYDNGDE